MNTVQVTINGNLVEGEVAFIQAILGQNTNILTAAVANTNFKDIEEFDVFMTSITQRILFRATIGIDCDNAESDVTGQLS